MRGFVSSSSQLVRAYYSGIGKTAVIYPAAFLVAMAMGQLNLGVVWYARAHFDAARIHIGFLAGIWSLTYILGCLWLRPLFNRVLPRFLVLGSTLAMALLMAGMATAGTLRGMTVMYAGLGLALSLFWPPMMGWLSTVSEGAQLGRILARYNLAWCAGSVISPFLCGWLSQRHVRYPLLASAGLLLLVFAFVFGASLVLPRVRRDRGTGARHDAAAGDLDTSCALRFPAWIGLFASFFGMGILMTVFPLAGLGEWGLPETVIGALLTLRGLANIAGFGLLGRIHRWHYRAAPMLVAQWLTVLAFAGLARFGSMASAAALLLALFGFSSAMSYTGSLFHGVAGSLNRARRMAIHESVLAAGLVLGSVAGGWLYEYLSPGGVFGMTALCLAGLTGVQTLVGRVVMPVAAAGGNPETIG